MTTTLLMPRELNDDVIVAWGRQPCASGAVVRYWKSRELTPRGIKAYYRRETAIARWRAEAHAAAAGLAPMVLSPVRTVVQINSGRARTIGFGYFVAHAEKIPVSITNEDLLYDVLRIRRLAREAGLTPPTDIRRDNLAMLGGRVVMVDWGSDNLRCVGRRKRR